MLCKGILDALEKTVNVGDLPASTAVAGLKTAPSDVAASRKTPEKVSDPDDGGSQSDMFRSETSDLPASRHTVDPPTETTDLPSSRHTVGSPKEKSAGGVEPEELIMVPGTPAKRNPLPIALLTSTPIGQKLRRQFSVRFSVGEPGAALFIFLYFNRFY